MSTSVFFCFVLQKRYCEVTLPDNRRDSSFFYLWYVQWKPCVVSVILKLFHIEDSTEWSFFYPFWWWFIFHFYPHPLVCGLVMTKRTQLKLFGLWFWFWWHWHIELFSNGEQSQRYETHLNIYLGSRKLKKQILRIA